MSLYLCVKQNSSVQSIEVKSTASKPYLRVSSGYIQLGQAASTDKGLKVKVGTNTYMPSAGSYTTTTTEAGYSGVLEYRRTGDDDNHVSGTFSGVYYSNASYTYKTSRTYSRLTSSSVRHMAYGKIDISWDFNDLSTYSRRTMLLAETTAIKRSTASSSSTSNAYPYVTKITSGVWTRVSSSSSSNNFSVFAGSSSMYVNIHSLASSLYYSSVGRATTYRSVYLSITASTDSISGKHHSLGLPTGTFCEVRIVQPGVFTKYRGYYFIFSASSESYSTTHESLLENTQQLIVKYSETCTDTIFSTVTQNNYITISGSSMYARITDAYTATQTITVE